MVAGIAAAVLLMLSKDISNRASNTEVLKFSNLLWVAAQHCSGRTFGLLLPLVFVHLPWLLCLSMQMKKWVFCAKQDVIDEGTKVHGPSNVANKSWKCILRGVPYLVFTVSHFKVGIGNFPERFCQEIKVFYMRRESVACSSKNILG